jgi:hypothetical protein
MKLALVIRGHVRDGLFSVDLKNHIDYIQQRGHVVELFLHSWSESEASSSYRELDRSHLFRVTPEYLSAYFKGCTVKKIIVQDDSKIKLYGNLNGCVSSTKCPVLAWKRMWAGKYKIMKYVYDMHYGDYDQVISTRYDMFTNPICITPQSVLKSIVNVNQPLSFRYSVCKQLGMVGIDNYYCGNIAKMLKLTHDFHKDLDRISEHYPSLSHQEEMVYKYAIDSCL